MLQHTFYALRDLAQNNHQISATIHFQAEHEIFKGHFPDKPVVPGVCQLQIISEVLAEAKKAPQVPQQIISAKFVAPVDPVATPSLLLKIVLEKTEDGKLYIGATYTLGEQTFCKVRAVYAA